jgi:Rieske Fe-S protein
VSEDHRDTPHVPAPSLWPIGFAVGIACILVGLVVSIAALVVGAIIALVFGLLWVRDVITPVAEPEEATPTPRFAEVTQGDLGTTVDRAAFLSLATIGVGGLIGAGVTLPVLGFAVLPSFTNQHEPNIDLGPIDKFPEGEYVIATFYENPEIGEVSRRTMFVRNNGQLKGVPSFTVLYSRCVHLGCPTQPNGPIFEDQKSTYERSVVLTPTQPAGFGCPCHGGQYDTEGNRTAGPPVRALDRAEFSIIDGNLHLGTFYSVAKVEGQGARARIYKYGKMPPGVHVDGAEAWLYPLEVPR